MARLSIRKKLANSVWLNRLVETLLANWIRLSYRTSSWDRAGFEEMDKALQDGEPVVVVLWHQRLMMAPYLFSPANGPICTLTSSSRAGRLAGNVVERFGLGTIAISSHSRHIALTRKVLAKMRQGVSVGMAADGPRGPARVASLAPVTWARASGKRVFVVSFSASRVHALPTWDQMWFPSPWTRGAFRCREWCEPVARFPSDAETERLRNSLETALNEVTDETDLATGRLSNRV